MDWFTKKQQWQDLDLKSLFFNIVFILKSCQTWTSVKNICPQINQIWATLLETSSEPSDSY